LITSTIEIITVPLSQVQGSRETALETVLVLRQVVSKARFQNIEQLVKIIRGVGQILVRAQPKGDSTWCVTLLMLTDRFI